MTEEAPEATPAEPAVEATPAEPAVEATPAEPAVEASNLGIWAFVLSMLGLIGLLPLIGSVLGFVLGWVALRRGETRGLRGGRGLAIAAVAVGIITLTVIAVGVAAYSLVVAFLDV